MREYGLPRMVLLRREQVGQSMLEYALVTALVAIGAIVCLKGFSSTYNWLLYLGSWFINSLS